MVITSELGNNKASVAAVIPSAVPISRIFDGTLEETDSDAKSKKCSESSVLKCLPISFARISLSLSVPLSL